MMKDPKNIKTWLDRHRKFGIQHFFIRLEESGTEVQTLLEQQSDVTLHTGSSAGVNEYDNIQVRQNKWVDEALKLASKNPNLAWLIHVDSDEIVVGDLTKLTSQPISVRTVWFQNVEAKFRNIPSVEETCFDAARFVNCADEPDKCAAYGNGKSAGRVAPDVSAHGPHRMKSALAQEEVKVDGILVEHYESCDFEMYKKKFKALAVQDKPSKIPFSYYNESIAAAKTGKDEDLEQVYRKYRVA
jgi:glycerol-3-phosphate cytidylyltransferase-like family protein